MDIPSPENTDIQQMGHADADFNVQQAHIRRNIKILHINN